MDYSLFTPQFKDDILKWLCASCTPYRLVNFTPSELCENSELLSVCLRQFQDKGFITSLNYRSAANTCYLCLTAGAYDFLNAGGFTFQAEILLRELEKAKLELEKLQSDAGSENHIEQIAGVTTIVSNLISAAIAFIR